jgi:transposase-like protein
MQRRKFSREFKIEAISLVGERGVSVAQASRDIDVARRPGSRLFVRLAKQAKTQKQDGRQTQNRLTIPLNDNSERLRCHLSLSVGANAPAPNPEATTAVGPKTGIRREHAQNLSQT